MRRHACLWVSCALVSLLAVAATNGQTPTFTYDDDFNSYANGAKPDGWNTLTTVEANDPTHSLDPAVMTADPANWSTQCTDLTVDPPLPSGCSLYGTTPPAGVMPSVVNYGTTWSGGGRLNLIHAGMKFPTPSPGYNGWVGAAWYKGDDAGHHTGVYPLNLQTDALKVTFDLCARTGNENWDSTNNRMTPADGGVFAVLPTSAATFANDINSITAGGGGMGWGGLGGFAIEFDIWDNNNYTNQTISEPAFYNPATSKWEKCADSDNHLGLDVYSKWLNSRLYSLYTELDPPASLTIGLLPRLVWVGDNNQPMHFTIYYNLDPSDPVNGGPGVVSVYAKVDPATKDPNEPTNPVDPRNPYYVPADGFGMQSGNPDGILVMRGCVGAWPTAQAIFGFTGSIGGCNSIYQIDNLHVETNAYQAQYCTPPAANPGTVVNLDPNGNDPNWEAAQLTQEGWDVQTYAVINRTTSMAGLKASIAFAEAQNPKLRMGVANAVTAINYIDNGCNGNLPNKQHPPGFPIGPNNFYGILGKGWIKFPPQDINNPADPPYPRDYYLAVNSDDGFELVIGMPNGVGQVIGTVTGTRGCGTGSDVGTLMDLKVPGPGVYPVQFLYFQGTGGGGVEFYRRANSNLLLPMALVPIGAAQAGYSDQPVVYGLKNGQPAPDLVSTYTPWGPAGAVTLSPTQKVGEVTDASGTPAFDIKTVSGPLKWGGSSDASNVYIQRDDAGETTALRFLDALGNKVEGLPTAHAAVVNYAGASNQTDGVFQTASYPFPGMAASATQFALRAEGFITFPAADVYWLGMHGDDDSWVRIGAQTIFTSGCCPDKVFSLNVTAAGTYPIRVEVAQNTGGARAEFYQLIPGVGRRLVNDVGSTITVHDAVATGPYVWAPNGVTIPADRKVAELGTGVDPGWNTTLSKLPDSLIALGIQVAGTGIGTALYENDLVGLGIGLIPQSIDTPSWIQYVDTNYTTPTPRFGAGYNRKIDQFLPVLINPAGSNADYNITALGYIEFPAAGDWALNVNSDDGSVMWIAGKMVTIFPRTTGYNDQTPAIVRVTAPGLYDIRVDYFERAAPDMMMVYQYLPGGTEKLLNDPGGLGLRVYRSLSGAPLTTAWRNPVRIPASAKVDAIDRGGDPGFRVQEVNGVFGEGDGNGGAGHDRLRTIYHTSELLDSVLGVSPSLSQYGSLVNDMVVPSISFPDVTDGTYSTGFGPPGGSGPYPNANYFAVRVTGLLALKAGGHIFNIPSDDGFNFWLGDYNVGQSGSLKGNSDVTFYIWVPEDGLYPFKLDYHQGTSGRTLVFNEVEGTVAGFVSEAVNTGNASKAYVNVTSCGYPTVDADKDGDVDLDDFGAFQACYTGDYPPAEGLSAACKCFDRTTNDGVINATDLDGFTNCVTGPGITWTKASMPNCTP